MFAVSRKLKQWKEQLKDERGEVNMVAIVLIILVAIGLVAIFRDGITSLLQTLIKKVEERALSI